MRAASAATDGTATASSFAKGLSVLAWVIDHDGTRADELAAGLELPLSSAYRYLRTLRDTGFVSVDDEGVFSAGARLRGQTAGVPANRLGDLALPFLQHLSEVTGETAVLTVRKGMYGVCVRQVESAHQIRLAFRVGQLLPLYAGAGQRVLLAYAPDPVVQGVLDGEVRTFTPSTPSRAETMRTLARIRSERFAVSRGELTAGAVALAVPVLKSHEVVCALCVAGPQRRCPSSWQAPARRELDRAAQSLGELLDGAA